MASQNLKSIERVHARVRRLGVLGFVLSLIALVASLASCGGAVETAPLACEPALHAVSFPEPVRDPGGTAETKSVECVQPGGWSHDGLSRVWCCE